MVRGVGFNNGGEYPIRENGKYTRRYILWSSMLRRSYDKNYHKDFPTYKNCTCDERWHNFQTFCKDIESIDGYDKWKENKIKIQLDKDLKIKGNKHYSRETCLFITRTKNIVISKITGRLYKIKNINTGEVKTFRNQSEFARENSFNSKGLNNMLVGYRNIYKGWILV